MNTLYQISNSPVAIGFARKVEVAQNLNIDFANKSVSLPFVLRHYANDVVSELFEEQKATMYTDNTKFVNNLGERVLADDENAIGEFDFLFNYVSVNQEQRQVLEPSKPLGEIMLEVIARMIARNDAYGNFNDMANFN